MANQPSTIFRPLPCGNCGRTITHPIWWRSDDEYIPLCGPCCTLGEQTFTPLGAIQQANAITMIYRMITDAPARYESAVKL